MHFISFIGLSQKTQRVLIYCGVLLFHSFIPLKGFAQALDYAFAVGAQDIYDNYTYANGLDVDKFGNTFISGTLEHISAPSTWDFDPGPGEYILENVPSTGCIEDIYVAKYDPEGNILWGFVIGGPSCDRSAEISTDEKGNVYISGSFGDTVDFDPGPGEFLMTSNDFRSGYVAKYSSQGTFIWAFLLQGLTFGEVKEIEVDHKENVYLIGEFGNSVDLDPSEAEYLISSAGSQDVFFAKYKSEGSFLWGHSFGDTEFDRGRAIEVDRLGNVIIGGAFWGIVDIDPSTKVVQLDSGEGDNAFLVKYSKNGRYRWGVNLGEDDFVTIEDLALDSKDKVYTTGSFSSENGIDFDAGSEEFVLSSEGFSDAYIARYNLEGQFEMATNFGGAASPFSSDIELGLDGSVFVSGVFSSTADFDPGPAKFELEGDFDAFVAKYSASGVFHWAFDIGEAFYGLEVGGFKVDKNDKIHIAGHFGEAFNNTLDFDPTLTSYIVDYVGANQDLYVAQYSDPEPLFRVNAGGKQILAEPLIWEMDTKHVPSAYLNMTTKKNNKTGSTNAEFNNPTPVVKAVFQDFRWDPRERIELPMLWEFPASERDYRACLLFVEHDEEYMSEGARVFDIVAEEELVVNDFDIYREAGAETTLRECFFTQVSDDLLNISLTPENNSGRPIISGIEITDVTAAVSRDVIQLSRQNNDTIHEIDVSIGNEIPKEVFLSQNYPNPFNPKTAITFGTRRAGWVRLSVYDLLGREISRLVDGSLDAGYHEVNFDGSRMPSGTYIYRLETSDRSATRQMFLLK